MTCPGGAILTWTCAGAESVKETCCLVNWGLIVKRENSAAPNCNGAVGPTGVVGICVGAGCGRRVAVAVGRSVDVGVVVAVAVGWVRGVLVAVAGRVGRGWAVGVVVGTMVAVAACVGVGLGRSVDGGRDAVGRGGVVAEEATARMAADGVAAGVMEE